MPESLIARPDTRFEIGAHPIAGAPAIYTYAAGFAGSTDDHDQAAADYIDAYALYYDDGINQIRVRAHYVDDSLGGLAAMLAVAPEEDLETLAVAFASDYVRTWN